MDHLEYARNATSEADGKRNIHENIFLNVLCISNCTLLFSGLCPVPAVHWNVAVIIIRITTLNIAHVVVNIDRKVFGSGKTCNFVFKFSPQIQNFMS